MTHDKRLTGYLMEHPHMLEAVDMLGAQFGGDMGLHLCDTHDEAPLVPGEIVVRDASGEPAAVIHLDGKVRRLDS